MADAKVINQGVHILLSRMDSHPEEFVPDLQSHYPHKWRALLLKVDNRVNHARTKHLDRNADLYTPDLSFLTDEEIFALHNKVQSIRGDLFTKEVMATLLADENRDLGELSSSFLQPPSATTKISISQSDVLMAKSMVFDRIKEIRRQEFDAKVMATILLADEDEEDEYEHERNNPAFGRAPVKREGGTVRYDSSNKYTWAKIGGGK